MNRQLFVHHYLPAHLASTLVAGSVVNFVLTESIEYPISIARKGVTHLRPRMYTDFGVKGLIVTAILSVVLVASFLFFTPLTYGTPGYVPSWRYHLSRSYDSSDSPGMRSTDVEFFQPGRFTLLQRRVV